MKQLVQSSRSGQMSILDIPAPSAQNGMIVVQNAASLVSAGTERALVDFAQKNLLQKARSRPDLVTQVKEKIQRDGLLTTIETVRTRLETPTPLGYSSAGTVIDVGKDVENFHIGDRVACAGFGYAVHSEIIVVPKNLVVPLPTQITFGEAAFTTLGAIALQGVRQAAPQLGDNVAVIGLGLLGQLMIQLLKANGCRVFGIDLAADRVALAKEFGAGMAVIRSEAVDAGNAFTANNGFDAVLITADTRSNDPLILAGDLARNKGVVVVVGAVGMEVPRKAYYMKELDLRLSRSYGPGRYDSSYEEGGIDYPYAYVRWTENRNMQAFVELVATSKIDVNRLITHRFPLAEAQQAYRIVTGEVVEPFLGILLTYPEKLTLNKRLELTAKPANLPINKVRIGLLGAGAFANSVLLPAMKKTGGLHLRGICTSSGLSATHSGQRFGFEYACSTETQILEDKEIDLLVIATPHHLHAAQVLAGLAQGKHIFCEKPLCITQDELQKIEATYRTATNLHLMVGFNRRFAPLAKKLKQFLERIHEPLLVHYRINGGYIPLDHWIQDPTQGGGRLVGEICHFVDFINYLTGELPLSVFAQALPNNGRYADDNLSIMLTYPNGSIGNILYAANGDKALGKERIEVFGGGRTAVLEDFRYLSLWDNGKHIEHRLRFHQDKGHEGEWAAFTHSLQTGQPTPISFVEIQTTTLATFNAVESLQRREFVPILSTNHNVTSV